LLNGLDDPLAAVYKGTSDGDPWPRFREICFEHRAEIGAAQADAANEHQRVRGAAR